MYRLEYTNKFKRDYKLLLKRGYRSSLIENTIALIANKVFLPAKYKAHKLSGEYKNCWECQVQSDWLLIWQINEETKNSHSD